MKGGKAAWWGTALAALHAGVQAAEPPAPAPGLEAETQTVAAASGTTQTASEAHGAIERLRAAGATVVALGEAEGVSGYLVRRSDGETYAAYVTPTGAVLLGILLSPHGEDVTRSQLEAARERGALEGIEAGVAPAPTGPIGPVEKLWEETQRADGFWLGERGPVMHVFADPTCPFSVEHVQGLEKHAEAGVLRVHVIPVGILGERAARRAVEISGSPEPRRAWAGTAVLPVDEGLGAVRVARNHALHAAWQVRGVPFSVWQGPRGVRVYYGAGSALRFAPDLMGRG